MSSGAEEERYRAYSPVIGGMRHLTWLRSSPPSGNVVILLCGSRYQVRPGADHRAAALDCAGCAAAWRHRMLGAS
ncbi:hypothetical protein [Amycolatopsis nigrescens]|uniref:hypothetical protein n=1 Tax=Amycolatopsis nigrescens TaxID=381445 RepID=UPI000372CF25|nr:hypothetical protein [Amycolatopsis nigrescens]